MSRAKGKNFTPEEEIQVCRSWLAVGVDPIVGTGQTAEKFHDRLAVHFNNNRPAGSDERPGRSLETKWGTIQHDTNKFCGTYATVRQLAISGASDEDEIHRALELYQKTHMTKGVKDNKPFKFLHCWRVLKDHPKWIALANALATKAQAKNVTGKRPTSERDNEDKDTDAADRPGGTKAAKAVAKEEANDGRSLHIMARAAVRLARSSEKRAAELKEANLMALFAIPLDGLDPRAVQFLRTRQAKAIEEMEARENEVEDDEATVVTPDNANAAQASVATSDSEPHADAIGQIMDLIEEEEQAQHNE